MLSHSQLEHVLQTALTTGGDFAELFFEDKDELDVRCTGGAVQGATSVRIHGAGLYLLSGTDSVYVYSSDTTYPALLEAARQAAELLTVQRRTGSPAPIVFTTDHRPGPNRVAEYPGTVALADKIKVLTELDRAARNAGPSVHQCNADFFDNDQRVTIVNSLGRYVEDRRVSCRLRLQVTVGDGELAQYDWSDYTRPHGFEVFRNNDDYITFAQDFVRGIQREMRAVSAPSCTVPVVLEAGSCGTFWHESCGHPLEASAIAGQSSEFCGRLGQQVASDKVTLLDDGSLPGLYGSSAVDDEGEPTVPHTLIKDGVLTGYLCDRLGGRRLGLPAGSGRRQGYAFAPTSRMSNTYLAPGNDDDDEMISSLAEGLYVKRIGGGVGGREFSVEVKEGWWIKNGQLNHQVKGLSLNGKGIDVIKRVDRVGRHLVGEGGSFCGAASGLIPVTSFQPRMRISAMTIGGNG